jgi:hypothetical protein
MSSEKGKVSVERLYFKESRYDVHTIPREMVERPLFSPQHSFQPNYPCL